MPKFFNEILLPPPTAEQVRASRAAAGVSQSAMAAALRSRQASTISQIERGEERMSGERWSLWMLIADQHPSYKLKLRK